MVCGIDVDAFVLAGDCDNYLAGAVGGVGVKMADGEADAYGERFWEGFALDERAGRGGGVDVENEEFGAAAGLGVLE